MDLKIWEDTIIKWTNSLNLTCTSSNPKAECIEEIVHIVVNSEKSWISFVNETFPNYEILDTTDLTNEEYISLCSLVLLYVCFSDKSDVEKFRKDMCSKLEESVQVLIRNFLASLYEKGDVFSVTKKAIMDEMINLSHRPSIQNAPIGDGVCTPVKAYSKLSNCNSPLYEFLQTPKRRSESKYRHSSGSFSNNDQLKKIKELTDQLVEEWLEKDSLQKRLQLSEIKCSDYEKKLKMKIEEIEQLKNEWHSENANYEKEIKNLQNSLAGKAEESEMLAKELHYSEKCRNILEKEVSSITSEKKTLVEQLKCSLSKMEECEKNEKMLSQTILTLQNELQNKEADLQEMKEWYDIANEKEKCPVTVLDESCDSIPAPESMGVVIEMLLKEEKEALKRELESMRCDKECLAKEVKSLERQLAEKVREGIQYRELNRDLVKKLDEFVTTFKEMETAQSRVMEFSTTISGRAEEENTCVFEHSSTTNSNGVDQTVVNLFKETDSKELHVIYDSSKELADSVSQLSFDDNETTRLTTILESLNESEDLTSPSDSTSTVEVEKTYEQFQIEELNREIITAKKSLIAFLRASMKNFEVLKIKENLINEMSKQHEQLESRITSLTELNTRLTNEIVNSKSISQVDSEYRRKELDSLKIEVESLKQASNTLKAKLAELEKTNEILVNKKEECLSELALLRERNKSLNSDLQNRVMSQLKQQHSCLGFIRNKQETEIELEHALKVKEEIDKRFVELRNMISSYETKLHLEMMLSTTEQRFHVASQDLLHATYGCLKWSAKSLEHQCFLIGQGDSFNEDDASALALQDEQLQNREKLKAISTLLNGIREELEEIEAKCSETCNLSDSLEVVVVGNSNHKSNKTFDIINLEDKSVNEKTFSIAKSEEQNTKEEDAPNTGAWVISPPPKFVKKTEAKVVKKEKPTRGETWVIPLAQIRQNSEQTLRTDSQNSTKSEDSSKTKSSYSSTYAEVPAAPRDSKTKSTTSFLSASDSATISDEVSAVGSVDLSGRRAIRGSERGSGDTFSESSTERKQWTGLERKIRQLENQLRDAKKENECLKMELADLAEKRKRDKENSDKRQEELRQSITFKYENQLEHLKSEMKELYNRELAKHKVEQSKLSLELKEKNKTYKEHLDEMLNRMWELGERLLKEQNTRRDLERELLEMKKKMGLVTPCADLDSKSISQDSELTVKKDNVTDDCAQSAFLKRLGSSSFVTIPTEDEEEVFDNRYLEDMKRGICKVEGPEGRLTELQQRNLLCPPHLKSTYPAETQVLNPKIYKDDDLRYGTLNFGQESHSLTDSDHSMTRSLLPGEKAKKKEHTTYKKPGPPTPSKNYGRQSMQGGELQVTPRRILRESIESNDRKSTPGRIKQLFSKSGRRESLSYKDENIAPATSRRKGKFFPSVKPFGGRAF